MIHMPDRRVRRKILDIVAMVAVPVTIIGGLAYSSRQAQDRAVDAATAAFTKETVENCRVANTSRAAFRADLSVILAAVSGQGPDGAAFVAQLQGDLSSPGTVDNDCNDDGRISQTDYMPGQAPADMGPP
jgi:hypothetical protein